MLDFCDRHQRQTPLPVSGPPVWTGRALQAESDDLESLVLRFCIRPHIMVSPSTADVELLMWADGDPRRTFLQASLQASHPAEAVGQ
jgi:hypothetical protein